jgi:hypothetical protein
MTSAGFAGATPGCLDPMSYSTPASGRGLLERRRGKGRIQAVSVSCWPIPDGSFLRFLELSGVGRVMADGTNEDGARAAAMSGWGGKRRRGSRQRR